MSPRLLETTASITICLSMEEVLGILVSAFSTWKLSCEVVEVVKDQVTGLYCTDGKIVLTRKTPYMTIMAVGHERPEAAETIAEHLYDFTRNQSVTLRSTAEAMASSVRL